MIDYATILQNVANEYPKTSKDISSDPRVIAIGSKVNETLMTVNEVEQPLKDAYEPFVKQVLGNSFANGESPIF
ncbi:hypothetical protein [Shimazuella kribbensis]|uniref:hypothetical protein n=1 Tax=Shimazuella kribbensis TaxID=139808 RepID=UPI00042526D8|nr:hypothetical protein [Shimazuella kribbensis]